ncbi:MAG: hypothetical protein R3D05_15745 [Dongiaceae bacterium]
MSTHACRCAITAIALLMISAGTAISPSLADVAGTVVPLPATDQEEIEKLIGKGIIGAPQPAMPLGSPESYLPPKGNSMTYQVVEKDKKTVETHKLEDTVDSSLAPGWRYSVENVGAEFFQKASDGTLHTIAEQDLGNKVLSRFSPGEPLIIPGLKPGESRKSTLQVAVYDLSDLKKVSHSGSLDVTYTYIGAYRVTAPAGTYDAALIRWDYSGKIGPADIKDSQYRFIASGAGMVAMAQIRSISAMLIYNDHTKQGKVLERPQ